MKPWNVEAGRGLQACLLQCSHSVDKEREPRAVTQLTQSLTAVSGEAPFLYSQARHLLTLALMRFGKGTESWKRCRARVRTPSGLSVNLSRFSEFWH